MKFTYFWILKQCLESTCWHFPFLFRQTDCWKWCGLIIRVNWGWLHFPIKYFTSKLKTVNSKIKTKTGVKGQIFILQTKNERISHLIGFHCTCFHLISYVYTKNQHEGFVWTCIYEPSFLFVFSIIIIILSNKNTNTYS